MEENNNVEKKEKKEKNKVEVDTKTKRKKAKVAIVTLSTIVVMFLGLQVFASINGYGNVFFMIKNLITTGNPAGNQEKVSDKYITLDDKLIELAEGLKIQANRLEIKDGKTKIYLTVKSQSGEPLPLKYQLTTKSKAENKMERITKMTGEKPENSDYSGYEDVLTLDYEVEENKIIVLKISDSSDKELRTLEINLETREITIKGEKQFEQISQVELEKYLSVFSQLNNEAPKADTLIYMAQNFKSNYADFMSKEDYDSAKNTITDREFTNAIIKEFYAVKAEFEYKKSKNQQDVEVLKGMQGWEFDRENDSYKPLTAGEDYHYGRCLKIEDVNYENEIYTIKYIYMLLTDNDQIEANIKDNLEELPQYETTIKLKRDDKQLYSKYQVISITDGTEVKEKVSTKIEENNVIKQTLKGAWYTIDLYENNEIKIRFTGEDMDKMYENLRIDKDKDYPINGISGKVSKIYQANNGGGVDPMTFFILENGTVEYIIPFAQIDEKIPDTFIITGKIDKAQNVVDLKTSDSDVVVAVLKNGEEVKIWNEWRDYDVEEKSNSNTTEDSKLENEGDVGRKLTKKKYIDITNWKQFSPEGLGMKFKVPDNFIQNVISKKDNQTVYVEMKGNITDKERDKGYQNLPVELYISNSSSETLDKFESLDTGMNVVASFDDDGWSDWRLLNAFSEDSDYLERVYGRSKNGQVQKVKFKIKVSGTDNVIEEFMAAVLENVNSINQ